MDDLGRTSIEDIWGGSDRNKSEGVILKAVWLIMSVQPVDLEAARRLDFGEHSWSVTEQDVILYALSLGCPWNDGRHVYENHEDFETLPFFAVLALYKGALGSVDLSSFLPDYSPVHCLHVSSQQPGR